MKAFGKRLGASLRRRPTAAQIRGLLPLLALLLFGMIFLPLAVNASKESKENQPQHPPGEEDAIYVDGSETEISGEELQGESEGVAYVNMEYHEDGSQVRLSMEDYLTGVLLAEISSSFHEEALKAQAVAARTYCLYRICGSTPRHTSGADVCDDYHHCMAYIDPASVSQESADRVRAAVRDCAGVVCLYDGELIDAVFHDSSYLYTESAASVWGSDIPYLQAVPSMEICKERTLSFNAGQILTALSEKPSTSAIAVPFGGITLGDDGRAETVIVWGVELSALRMRTVLGLPSTAFGIIYDPESALYTFTVRGYGHGVGLSQQGAEAMAQAGYRYDAILRHYYSGCTVEIKNAEFFARNTETPLEKSTELCYNPSV